MSEINYLEIIQNKLDALVDKIIQKENSDENFRITYAQILEKINTKMDVFSGSENFEKIGLISLEIRNMIKDRQNIVDTKFNAIKGEFDNINDILVNSLKTPEFLAAFNKIQNQIHFFSEEQENQKEAFNSIISHIEKFGTFEETNDILKSNFAIVKEQNTIVNENLNKQINLINNINEDLQNSNKKALEELNTIIFSLKEFEESLNDDAKEVKDFVTEKVDEIISKIHETDSFIDVLNNNLTTLVQVIGNLFDDEDFQNLQTDVADILAKTSLLSESLKNIATKEELIENSSKNKEELKKHNQVLISALEQKIVEKLDFSDLEDIKEYTEKMFFQGTEVLKEEIWSIKDTVTDVQKNSVTSAEFDEKINELKNQITDDITDTLSAESVAAANQINEISATIEDLRKDLSDIILNEQNEQITTALNNLQSKFVSQLIQIAENIDFTEEADEINDNIFSCTDELREKISSDISDIKEEILLLKNVSLDADDNIVNLLEKIDNAIQTDINKDLKTLISGFKLLTSGLKEDKDYVYTLPDIESDLSKIRLDLNNLQKVLVNTDEDNTENQSDITTKISGIKAAIEKLEQSPINTDIAEVKALFDTLNEDIASISKRTNKLILSSDEVNKTLKSNIENFSALINGFEKQSKEFYNSAFVNNLDIKIDNISRTGSSLVQSDKVLTEAFMYLAEWIDTASDSFDEIKSDLAKVTRNLLSEEETVSEKLERTVKTLSQKVEEQDAKLDAVDEKLNRILAQQNETKELKSLIEYVASQVSVTNEKIIENDKLAQRIASMEKQLKKIEKNIAIITEYIDEDEEDEFDDDDE